MSQYERRRRSNVLSGDGSRLPNGGNTRVGQRGSGHLAAFSVCLGGRLDKTGTHATDSSRGEAVGKPGVAGVYTNQRLNLSKLWEGPQRICQDLKPDPGNPAVRHFRGASRNVRHGETVNPPAIERAGPETPHLQRGALDLYPNQQLRCSLIAGHHCSSARAFAVNPSRLPARPCGLRGLTAKARPSKGPAVPSMQNCARASPLET